MLAGRVILVMRAFFTVYPVSLGRMVFVDLRDLSRDVFDFSFEVRLTESF